MSTKIADSKLWAQVVAMAREGVDTDKAFREIRKAGGRDLTKDDTEFSRIYERFKAQPLFARNMVLTLRRSELQQDVVAAMLSIDTDTDAQVDAVLSTLRQFEEGSFEAFMGCIERIRTSNPTLADSLTENARALWPAVFAQLDAQEAARNAAAARPDATAQLELPLSAQPVGDSPVADVRAEVR